MQALTVPASESEVIKEWLQTVLTRSPVVTAGPLELSRIGEDYGFASTIIRCRWRGAGSLGSVVVKLWSTEKAGLQEIHFYQIFAETLGIRVPHCYYAAADPETQRAVLVLEDVQDALQGDCLELLTLERAKNVARSLAGLHATWLGRAELDKFSWLADASKWTPDDEWFQSRRTLFLERFGEPASELTEALLFKLEHTPSLINERLADAPATLLHGDFHLDNLLFERQTWPVLLDWSRPLKGPVALNLIELLYAMTPLEHFDNVLTSYLEAFNKQIEEPLSKEALAYELGGAFLRKFTISTLGMANSNMPLPRGPRLLQLNLEQASDAAEFFYERDPDLFSFLT